MAYEIFKVPDEKYGFFENVILEFKLTRDKDLEENQIAIKASIYEPGTNVKKDDKTEIRPFLTREVIVDYAEVLANCKKYKFNHEFLEAIFYALNSELAPHGYQLKDKIIAAISKGLMEYIPNKKVIGKDAGTTR
jgi:hypothetical protein